MDTALEFVKEFSRFLRARKKYWLIPIFITMIILGIMLVLAKGSAVTPFIYTVF